MSERRRRARPAVLVVLALAVAACNGGAGVTPRATTAPTTTRSPAPPTEARAPTELRLMTHSSFAISDDVIAEFEAAHNVRLRVLDSGDAGSLVNQAILARDAPLADVLYGVDNSFLSRALEADIFAPYRSPALDAVPEDLQLDPESRVTPIDYGDVCLNYDRDAFTGELPPPARLEDLADPRYEGMLVVQNPATSSPGLAFVLATVARFGEDGDYTWLDYWRDLRANDVLVSNDWSDAYYGQFSGGAGEGARPIVVSYASSPVAEVVFAEPQPSAAPTAVVEDGCFRQIEFAGVLAGTTVSDAAEALIDFMLSERFQEDIPLNMFVFPANSRADLPPAFEEHAAVVDEPVEIEPAVIDAGRERWIEEWTDVVLR